MHYVEINEFVASRLLVHADNSLRFVCADLQIGELSYSNFAIAVRVIIQKETKKKCIRVKFQRNGFPSASTNFSLNIHDYMAFRVTVKRY